MGFSLRNDAAYVAYVAPMGFSLGNDDAYVSAFLVPTALHPNCRALGIL